MCSGWNGYRKYMNGFIDYTKRILCGVLCLMLLLSGCGGQKEVDIFDKDQLDIPVADELPLTGEELMAPGRLLRMNLPDFKTLHPLQAMSEAAANVFSLIFDPAVRIEQDGSCTPNVLEGWEYDSETLIYTFHIRKNVAFHDETYGTADADDLLYAIKYNIEHENAAMHHYTEGILAYTKTDELTFTVQVEQPKHNLLLLFWFYVVPKEYYASRGPNTSVIPVGTGAYKVSGYTEGERMIAYKNPRCSGKIRSEASTSGKKLGYLVFGQSYVIVGEENGYYRIAYDTDGKYENGFAYAPKNNFYQE